MIASKRQLLPTECNFVASDRLWKDHVSKEVAAAKDYPSKWGVTEEKYKEMLNDIQKGVGQPDLPKALQKRPVTPIEKYITVKKSPPYPQTTTGKIGWRSANLEYNLEIYGRPSHPKGSIYKRFDWPLDAL